MTVTVPAHHLDLAVLCNAAYDTRRTDIWSVRETDALVKDCGSHIRIAFRGTDFGNLWPRHWTLDAWNATCDLARDLRACPWRNSLGQYVHRGFGQGAEDWCSRFGARLASHQLPLVLAGHSLGAAVAVQSLALLQSMGLRLQECVVFGEPASFYWGAEQRARRGAPRTTSYLNRNDWIRFAPPWGEPAVPRTRLFPEPGINTAAHDIHEYTLSLDQLAAT